MKVESDSQYKQRKGLIGGADVQHPNVIHITLENEEEKEYLWHLLNNGNPFENYGDEYISKKDLERLDDVVGTGLWRRLTEIFSPPDRRPENPDDE